MTIHDCNFIYDGMPSEFYDVIMCNFDSVSNSSNDEESNLVMNKTVFNNEWDLFDIEYTNPLKFVLTIAHPDGTYFDAYQQRAIKKWLCKKKWCPLQIIQEDLGSIEYKCVMTFNTMVTVGENAGMSFNVTCNSPFAYSGEYEQSYIVTDNSSTFEFYNDSDFEDYLYPVLEITSNTNGTIELINQTENNRSVKLNNCVVGEVITMDCKHDLLSSSIENKSIIGNWNGKFFQLLDGSNIVTINGNCTAKFTYQYARRVGG